ncbi:MAG: 16S rRNA (cytidine(1402)-2'-O)-methyltransferase [Thermodesulfobacteriota bacterium]
MATPIGNLRDITLRALDVLKSVDWIAAEDTRHTGILLKAYDIQTRLISCHEYNENERIDELIAVLKSGGSIALVSDAGTPLVSDPGFRLVRAAAAQHLPVVPIPGPCAAIAGLSISGFPTDSFVFLGFAPKKPRERLTFLKSLEHESKTLIFYESAKRIQRFLEDMTSVFGDRLAVLCRELTKLHEEVLRGTILSIREEIEGRHEIKGELTVIVAGCPPKDCALDSGKDLNRVLEEILLDQPKEKPGTLAKMLAQRCGILRSDAYRLLQEALRSKRSNA